MGWNAVINFETRGLIVSNLRDYDCDRPGPRDVPHSGRSWRSRPELPAFRFQSPHRV